MLTSEWPEIDYTGNFIKEQVDWLERNNIDVEVHFFKIKYNIFNYIKEYFTIRKIIKNGKFDLIHVQFGYNGLLAFPSKLPVVISFRGTDLYGHYNNKNGYTLRGKFLYLLSNFSAPFSKKNLLVSEALRKKLWFKKNIEILPSGVDFELFKPFDKNKAREILGLNKDKIYIFFGGNKRNPIKRAQLAYDSFNLLKKKIDCELLEIKNLSREEILLYLNASDVVLLTSVHEGSPNVIKEALACNKKIVTTNVGDVQERLGKFKSCFICYDDSPEAIAENIYKCVNTDIVEDLRNNSMDFEQSRVINKLMNIYKSVISNNESKG